MNYRELGKPGLTVREIGFGCEEFNGQYKAIRDMEDTVACF